MSWIEEKYVGLLSAKLEKFQRKSSGIYCFRCPICGDSKSNPNKTRGYLYERNGGYRMHCHNCGVSMSFTKFIKEIDPVLGKEFVFVKYIEPKGGKATPPDPVKKSEPQVEKCLLDKLMQRMTILNASHAARVYLAKRLIPEAALDVIYYCDDIRKIAQLAPKYVEAFTREEARIIIPAFDRNGHLVALTARDFTDTSSLRYIGIQISTRHHPVYGLDRVNMNDFIYVVEGPLDSFFLPNCVAMGTSALHFAKRYLPVERSILAFDNQPRNQQIIQLMGKAIGNGFTIVVWPDKITAKDINEMVLAGIDVQTLISQNLYRDLAARMAVQRWQKL